MKITMLEYPSSIDWYECKRRALVTVGKNVFEAPNEKWRHDILNARHSTIRRLRFSFLIEDIPSWVSVHLCRHIHAQPYVKSQRNDRQNEYDRNKAPQNAPVCMIWDMDAEELMTIANKRLCKKASEETRAVVKEICQIVSERCPDFKPFLVPMCVYHGGFCHEMKPCGQNPKAMAKV
jgi:thymidylate synthase ThyX